MPAPGGALRAPQVRHQAGPEGVQVEVPHELQEVRLLLTNDRLVPVLEQMAHPAVAAIEGPAIAGEAGPHAPGQGRRPGPQEEVGMVRQETPSVDGHRAGRGLPRQAADELPSVAAIAEDRAPLDPPPHAVVKGSGPIESWNAS